jgi:hypothetical protein
MAKAEGFNPLAAALEFWPLVMVPIMLFAVRQFGNNAGNLILGALFFYLIVMKADGPVRRLMIVLAVIGAIFETANVAAGFYSYAGTIGSPVWVSLGWGILGWWVTRLEPTLSKIPFIPAFAISVLMVCSNIVLGSGLTISIPIAIAGLYVVSVCSKKPFGIYAFTTFFGVLAEYSGTATKTWTYYSLSGTGLPVPVDLASLALSYAVVLMFCFWLSGYEKA